MKKIVIVFALFVLSISTKAQLPSNCNVPDILKSNYEFDVTDLTFTWLREIHSPDTSLIDVPQWAKEPIWEGLAAIYNRHDIIEIDSLFNKYCVHKFPTNIMINHSITLEVDTSFAWTRNWAQLQTITGIPSLDSLLAKYGFNVYRYFDFTDYSLVELETTQSINVLPLCDSLVFFPGIISAHPSGYAGDGSRITYKDSSDMRFYTFTLAWGDCLAGCTSFHTWKFIVYPDCTIDFLGIENYLDGSKYPEPKNCNLSNYIPSQSTIQPVVTTYPNPAEDFQTIRTSFPGGLSFILYDEFGRKILLGTFQQETTLNVRTLNRGLYFLVIQEDNKTLTTKKIMLE